MERPNDGFKNAEQFEGLQSDLLDHLIDFAENKGLGREELIMLTLAMSLRLFVDESRLINMKDLEIRRALVSLTTAALKGHTKIKKEKGI